MRVAGTSGALFMLVACAGQAPLALPPSLGIEPVKAPAPPASVTVAAPSAPNSAPFAPATTPAPEPLPVSLGDIGAEGPLELLATSTSGAWVALCDGTEKSAKLVLGSGSGEAIDDVLASSPDGRYVVVLQNAAAQLVDAKLGTRVNLSELGADVRRVRADYAEHRTLSFDASGEHLAYLRTRPGGSQLVVRTLETGQEQIAASGPGEVFRLKLSADARYVTFDVLREDSNHNGKLDWPAPEEPTRKNACEKPHLPRFRSFAYQGRGDVPTRGVLAVETGAVRDVPELLTPLGQGLLVREADGSLRLDQGGKRTLLAPASCGGRVLFADAERGLLLATCAPPPPPKKSRAATPVSGKREVWLFASGYAKNLQSELYETTTDRDAVVGARLVPLYPGSDASLLDLERREILPLAAGSRVIATRGAQALIWRGNELYRYDALAKREQLVARGVLKNPDLLQAGSTVLLSPFVVVACEGQAFASPARSLALSTNGFVLTASAGTVPVSGRPASAIQGPLHWVDAKVPAPHGPP